MSPFLTNLLKFGEGAARGYENAHLRRVAEEKDRANMEFEKKMKEAMLEIQKGELANSTRRTDSEIKATESEDTRRQGAFNQDYGSMGPKPIGLKVGGNDLELPNNMKTLESLLGLFASREGNISRERTNREDNNFRKNNPELFGGDKDGKLNEKDKAALLMKFITDNNNATMSLGTDRSEANRLSRDNWRNAHKMAPDIIPEHPADIDWRGVEEAKTREEAESQWSTFMLTYPDIADEVNPDALKQLLESKPSIGPARDIGPKKAKKTNGGKFIGSGPRSGTDLY